MPREQFASIIKYR